MDGPGGWPVNVIVSHLWRATKDQKACTQACPGVPDACAGNGRFLNFSNSRRRESSRDGKSPGSGLFQPAHA